MGDHETGGGAVLPGLKPPLFRGTYFVFGCICISCSQEVGSSDDNISRVKIAFQCMSV